jgi:hypothetical protein
MNIQTLFDIGKRLLISQRGEVGDEVIQSALNSDGTLKVGEDGFIPGTTYKSQADLLKGHLNLKEMADKQATELGTVRKEHGLLKTQAETLATVLKDTLGKQNEIKPTEAKTVDYPTEIANVEKQIQELDPMAPDYQKTLASLVSKSNKLSAADQHEKTLSAAAGLMKKELSERDVKSAHEKFYSENPTFNTPEMQAKIKEYITKDSTGMSDPLSAFREIQRDEAIAAKTALEAENAEYKRLIDLNEGKKETGKVVVKPQGGGPPPPKTKVTGKDLDAGMKEVLAKSRDTGV